MPKKIMVAFLALFMLCLSSCQEKPSDAVMEDVVAAVEKAIPDSGSMVEADKDYLKGFFSADPDDFASYIIKVQSNGSNIDEFGIFEAKSNDDISNITKMLDEFFETYRAAWNDSYLQSEYPKLRDAEYYVSGKFVMYCILNEETKEAALTAFKDTAS